MIRLHIEIWRRLVGIWRIHWRRWQRYPVIGSFPFPLLPVAATFPSHRIDLAECMHALMLVFANLYGVRRTLQLTLGLHSPRPLLRHGKEEGACNASTGLCQNSYGLVNMTLFLHGQTKGPTKLTRSVRSVSHPITIPLKLTRWKYLLSMS